MFSAFGRLFSRKLTLETAKIVAEMLKGHNKVHHVDLFGSVSRTGKGNDLDLVLCVDPDTFMHFAENLHKNLLVYDAYNGNAKSERLQAACEALGDSWQGYLNRVSPFVDTRKLDIFLLPTDWRAHTHHLRAILPGDVYGKSDFIDRISRDAIRLC